jgi:hypothetical protein
VQEANDTRIINPVVIVESAAQEANDTGIVRKVEDFNKKDLEYKSNGLAASDANLQKSNEALLPLFSAVSKTIDNTAVNDKIETEQDR